MRRWVWLVSLFLIHLTLAIYLTAWNIDMFGIGISLSPRVFLLWTHNKIVDRNEPFLRFDQAKLVNLGITFRVDIWKACLRSLLLSRVGTRAPPLRSNWLEHPLRLQRIRPAHLCAATTNIHQWVWASKFLFNLDVYILIYQVKDVGICAHFLLLWLSWSYF